MMAKSPQVFGLYKPCINLPFGDGTAMYFYHGVYIHTTMLKVWGIFKRINVYSIHQPSIITKKKHAHFWRLRCLGGSTGSLWWISVGCFSPHKKRFGNKQMYEASFKTGDWLVVSTHLKNISQLGSYPQMGVNIKHFWNHHLGDV